MKPPMLQPGQRYATEDELYAARQRHKCVRALVIVPEGAIPFGKWEWKNGTDAYATERTAAALVRIFGGGR